jgi:undecaprenyl diphosphate synthase
MPLPQHIGIIMDGNGRWAKAQGLPRTEGHRAGVKAFDTICEYACDLGIPYLTFYAFSTENWSRPQAEVDAIMNLLRHQLDEMERREEENRRKGFRIRYIGDLGEGSPVPSDILARLRDMEERSSHNTRTTVNVAVNYGGQREIVQAAQSLALRVMRGELHPKRIDEAAFANALYTAGQPVLDLLIRPSGELRLSNFMLWQAAYAELWFSDILWPDFDTDAFDTALADYAKRSRRFGDVG